MKKHVEKFLRACHVCQLAGKPDQNIPKAPLMPIPSTGEPFQEVVIDVVGPLPRTKKGHSCLLTMMDRASRYPEASPLRKVSSLVIVEALVGFFTHFGLPKTVQSGCGSNFTSKYFKKKMTELGIKHITSSPYHPESQGTVECFHQTLKSRLRKYCIENEEDWDKGVPYLLFAIRSSINSSLGFTPFDIVFGHHVRGPLNVIREHWDGDAPEVNLLDYVSDFRTILHQTLEFAKNNLKKTQKIMKNTYDIKSKERVFKVGQKVMVLLPIVGNPFQAKFSGPCEIVEQKCPTDFLVSTPWRRKKFQLCHVNMLKLYVEKEEIKTVALSVLTDTLTDTISNLKVQKEVTPEWPKSNLEAMKNLSTVLTHLIEAQAHDKISLVERFPTIFKDTPGHTSLLLHDVEVGNARPIKQNPYHLNPQKCQAVEKEVRYMLENNLIVPSESPWSSPVVLVKKESGEYHLCFDYHKVNAITQTDSFPLPRVDDCIDRVVEAKFITKIDMLKGYWQIGMSERAQTISAFVTRDGLYECLVMPFGMKNSASTFQRLMIKGIKGCVVYIDDVVVLSDDWNTHLERLEELFRAVEDTGLVVNLTKCKFARAQVNYLGHKIGLGHIAPKDANITAILNIPVPKNQKDIRKFLGMAGYYRRFIKNFSDVIHPLTELLKKQSKFTWDNKCPQSFNLLKSAL